MINVTYLILMNAVKMIYFALIILFVSILLAPMIVIALLVIMEMKMEHGVKILMNVWMIFLIVVLMLLVSILLDLMNATVNLDLQVQDLNVQMLMNAVKINMYVVISV
ncbi:uncharacterized protein LOC111618286 [Centruroides sculpturatus]|uniref:uncharacterized protein LOC111618286 n=1 Tax=Centruroides sculpturatus TaxID=218467 RepID=UPI000C6D09C2|nr:uncharacterized protein LOC111618286 [Centruroides sculpturatus]